MLWTKKLNTSKDFAERFRLDPFRTSTHNAKIRYVWCPVGVPGTFTLLGEIARVHSCEARSAKLRM